MIMKRLSRIVVVAILCLVIASVSAIAETISCTECGMTVDLNSKFAAKIVQGDTARYFCDIGDLFAYLNRKGLSNAGAQVKDYGTGEWIDASKAFYVRAEKKFKTPMGWGVAAFHDKNSAEESGVAMGFDAMAKTVK